MCEDKNNNNNDCRCHCCPQGPQGPQGIQGQPGVAGPAGPAGQQGSQGPQGPQGLQGLQGMAGPKGDAGEIGMPGAQGEQGEQGEAGEQGLPGLQGLQGLQGLKGDKGDSADSEIYMNVYRNTQQVLDPYLQINDSILFNQQNSVSGPLDFDLTMMNINGDIKILKHGIYNLNWLCQARINPPLVQPVPSFSFGFFINGVISPGSVSSAFTSSPNDDAAHTTGNCIVELQVGDILRLRNACISSVILNPAIAGSVFPISVASVNMVMIKKLP